MMPLNLKSKISEIILSNHLLMLPLEHFGISLPTNEKTIQNVCDEFQISTNLLLSVLNLFNNSELKDFPVLDENEIIQIISYLRNCHEYYLNEKLPKIENFIKNISNQNKNDELILVRKFIADYMSEVKNHLEYENNIVFPYIEKLIKDGISRDGEIDQNFTVKEYEDHHDNIQEKLNDLKNLLIKYIHLQDVQLIRRELLFELFEFESDLNIHSDIEDLILIPSVDLLEKRRVLLNE